MHSDIAKAHERIDKKVSWSHIWSIIGAMIAIIGGMMTVLYAQNGKLSDGLSEINRSVAIVQTEIKNFKK